MYVLWIFIYFSEFYFFKIGKLETGAGSSIVSMRGLLSLIKGIAKKEIG